jgi:molybdopterin-guanine dinucleotide biosynthesis protein A
MGGVDKGLQPFLGKPLAQHVLSRVQPQVACSFISANRHLETYQAWGVCAYPDAHPDFAGPLAGFAVAMQQAQTPYVLIVPCDTPYLPLDLAERLYQSLTAAQADMAVAMASEINETGNTELRLQPTCCLLSTALWPSLEGFIQSGGRKIRAWMDQHAYVRVAFDQPSDTPLAFTNLNTLRELHALEQQKGSSA